MQEKWGQHLYTITLVCLSERRGPATWHCRYGTETFKWSAENHMFKLQNDGWSTSHSGVCYMLSRCCLESSAFLAPAKIPQEQHDMQVFLTRQRLIVGFLGFPSLLGMIWGQTSHQANRSAIFKPLQCPNHTSLNKCLNYCTCLKGMFPT